MTKDWARAEGSSGQLDSWHKKTRQCKALDQSIAEFVQLMMQIRLIKEQEQARVFALRAGFVPRLAALCQQLGFEITQTDQVALMQLQPMQLISLFLLFDSSFFSARPLAVMNAGQAKQQLTDLTHSLPDSHALVEWVQFHSGVYTNGLLAAFESQLAGNPEAHLIHCQDLKQLCPGYQSAEVRQQAKQATNNAAGCALAGLITRMRERHPDWRPPVVQAEVTGLPAMMQQASEQGDYQRYAKLLLLSQNPERLAKGLAQGSLAQLLQMDFAKLQAVCARGNEPELSRQSESVLS